MTPRNPALARLRATRQRHAQTATEGAGHPSYTGPNGDGDE